MNIIALDDDKKSLEELVSYIRECRPQDNINGFSDSAELLDFAGKNKCDTAFLDLRLKSGIETAKKLKEHNNCINIILISDCTRYAISAMKMHASGYIEKPVTAKKIQTELSDLRYPVSDKKYLLKVKCFGNFDVYLPDGTPLRFERSKAKELFAYLVYRQNSSCTIREIAARLFENEFYDKKHQVYLQKIISSMMNTLKTCGAENVIIKNYNSLSANSELLDCDFYRFISQETNTSDKYTGEFMAQYSWAEFINGYLERISQGKL